MLHDLKHPSLGTVRVLSTPVGMDGDGFEPAAATPAFGSETRDILATLGFPRSDVDRMLESGATTEQPHTAR
ncbi:MAG: hypothetical protein ABI305_04165, partial [Tepidiformaceae bacterium]